MRINGKTIKEMNYKIQDDDLIDSSVLCLQVGKKSRKFVLFQYQCFLQKQTIIFINNPKQTKTTYA